MKKENNKRKLNFKEGFKKIRKNVTKNQSKVLATIIQIAYYIVAGVAVTEILNKYPQIENDEVGMIICIALIVGVAVFHIIEYAFKSEDK